MENDQGYAGQSTTPERGMHPQPLHGGEASFSFDESPEAGNRRESTVAAFSNEFIAELKEVFQLFDQQGRGKMSCSDLRVAFRVLGYEVTREQMQALASLYSGDRKHYTFEEFLDVAAEVLSNRSDAEKTKALEDAFALFDTAGAGVISADQLSRVLGDLVNVATETDGTSAESGTPIVMPNEISVTELCALLGDLGIEDVRVGMTRGEFIDLFKERETIV